MIDKLPEDKTYSSLACKPARAITGHNKLRCGQCPFPDCYKDKPDKMRYILRAKIAELEDMLMRSYA